MSSSRQFSDGRTSGKAPEKTMFLQTCNLLSRYMKEKGSLRDLNLEIGGKVESLEAIVKPGSSLAASASTMNLPPHTGKSGQPSSEKQPSMDSFPHPAKADSSVIILDDGLNEASTSKEESRGEPKTTQLTIFYSGKVLVFDDYSMDKARELVSIAKKSSSKMSYGIVPNTIQEKPNSGSVDVASTSSAREGLPPRPQASSGKQPAGISSNTCKEKMNPIIKTAVAPSSKSQEQLSPQTETNGSDLPIARRSSLHRFLEKRKDRAAVRRPYQNPERPATSSKADEQFDLNI